MLIDQTVKDRNIAFIDIGTNSIRLLLVRIEPNGAITTLSVQKETVRLGEAEFINGQLQAAAMQRAVAVCKQFAEMARNNHADDIITVATSATREAKNKRDFLNQLKDQAGLDVRVISGIEEARLIYLGIAHGYDLAGQTALMIDIGGGSTELIVGDQHEYHHLDSLKLGSIRLATLFFSIGENGPITDEEYQRIKEYVKNSTVRSLQKTRDFEFDLVLGSSGTVENLADITIQREYARPRTRDDVITLAQLSETISNLRSLGVEARRDVQGINLRRADIIVPGAAIIETILEEMGLAEFKVTDQGVRNGLLVDYLSRTEHASALKEGSVRLRSVLKLARKCNFDEAHGNQVSKLALSIFDSAREEKLHALGRHERELLHYASLLHDIGIFLSYSDHQAHSYYLVRNAELLGFDQMEIAAIAALAFFHRKKYPKMKHSQYRQLDRRSRDLVRVCAPIIRIAETLDRSHQGLVDDARVVVTNGMAELQIVPAGDCQMEMWGIQRHKDAFKKSFGKKLDVRLLDAETA
jgi:exopolyphosphatase/guanosine-5'-triphosphate,3'-diphosphate pyrophosphatase